MVSQSRYLGRRRKVVDRDCKRAWGHAQSDIFCSQIDFTELPRKQFVGVTELSCELGSTIHG